MMPVIRISDQTWERLKQHAKPLEDTVDDVVNTALDALDAFKAGTRDASSIGPIEPTFRAPMRRTPRGNKLPQKEFRLPLLETLAEMKGGGDVSRVRKLMESKMKPRLSGEDYQIVSSGDPRWWNATCWERNSLVKEGFLRSDSNRGVWELSEKGWNFLASLTTNQSG